MQEDGPQIIENVSIAALSRTIVLSDFIRTKVRSKFCVVYPDYPTNLVLRAVAAYIARRFRIVPVNRDRVVSGVIEGLMDSTPFTIIRRDFTSFYESLNADKLRDRLIYDTSLPRSVRHYLNLYFASHCPKGQYGLPRGVGLTAILAEMAMENFDRQVRSIEGVYRYFRYSDDILVFTYANSSMVESKISSLVPEGMRFNPKKSSHVDFTLKDRGTEKSFEYLGYRFSTESGVGAKEPRVIDVTIADVKIKRLKSRLILAIKSFKNDYDCNLLVDRLKLLSSNYQVNRHGVSSWVHGNRVRSGIYYNYRKCGSYSGITFTEIIPKALAELDDFTHYLLKSPRSEFRADLAKHLTRKHRLQLSSISFRLGFASRRMIRIPYARLAKLKGAWRNG